MVQLSPSSPQGCGEHQLAKNAEDIKSQGGVSPLQTSISSALSPLQAFETYLDNGLVSLKHKIRNIEKKKVKLEDYRERLSSGETLNQDQLEAVEKYEEVLHNLEFAKELQKTFSVLNQDLLKAQKKAQRRENLLKIEVEKKRLRAVLQVQYMLQTFSQDHVQKDFKDGSNGAMYISPKEHEYLSKFSKLVCPKKPLIMNLEDQTDQSSIYLWNLLEGSEKPVAGTNYKYLKDLVARMLECGYFDSVPDPPEPKKPEPVPERTLKTKEVKTTPVRDQSGINSTPDPKPYMEYIKRDIQSCEPIRNCIQKMDLVKEAKSLRSLHASCTKPEGLKPWGAHADLKPQDTRRWPTPQPLTPLKPWETGSIAQTCPAPKKIEAEPKERRDRVPKVQVEAKPAANNVKDSKVSQTLKKREVHLTVQETSNLSSGSPTTQSHRTLPQVGTEFCSSPTLPKDPELRKQKLKDLIDQIKGTYNFMQDSMLEFEFPSPRSSSSRPPLQSTPIVTTELSRMSKQDSVLPPEKSPVTPTPEEEVFSSEEIYVANSSVSEPLPERDLTPVTVSNDQLVSPKTQTSPSALQIQQEALPMSPRCTPVSVSSSPFQGMQAVFKVNPPLPLRKEPEMKHEVRYSPEFHQTFSTVSTQTLPHCSLDANAAEQNFIQEPLTGSPYTSSSVHQMNNVTCYTSSPNMMPRITQPYVTSRGTIRGSNRGRIMTNGFRCPTPYKGNPGPESYRGAHCPTNGSYMHTSYPGREYNTAQFVPRDGNTHLCHKKPVTTNRPSSRGWSESSQLSSPERDEVFNSIDSGHGDSRSLSPADVSMSSQAATLLPVHVYPLPQQMRVAFSAARTSNFAPGTLDQPIAFDLLLNNLGDSFEFQLGHFMCPVNGTYVFIFHMLKLAVNVPLYVNLMKNDEVLVSAYANDGAPDHETASNHAVLQLFQGDQIWLRLHRGAIYGSSWKYSTFSGYLLYQD
ncbi:caprin-2 [Spea bombifrons]|uniref:caprin-2 n=1 Tax=Spea bombifrons TaxID=233779 RepID=UPI002349B5DF|nr:caprin-2 [Spea bombifrons]